MTDLTFNDELLDFLQGSPTPFHAVANMAAMLEEGGFVQLDEANSWELKPGQRYFVIRNDSALVAFKTGDHDLVSDGIHLAGTHTDSPCLKVKPNPVINKQGYVQLGVEVYGGALLNPWFDRDLSLAGRVDYKTKAGELESVLIDLLEPVAFIPSLAIHLDREANTGRTINAQKQLPPILLQLKAGDEFSFDDFLVTHLQTYADDVSIAKVLSHELYFYDTQPPAEVGLDGQFIASARLDNLLSCFVACRAMLDSKDEHAAVLVCNDHEEVGSSSTSGAQGPFLKAILERMLGNAGPDALERTIHQSLMLSIDNAHGVHPNYMDVHDEQHRPLLNSGPVIKINANQRYASNSQTVAQFKSICDEVNVPYQAFVVRSDMACGSTIGPIIASALGVPTVDIGVATFGMHSIRELAGSADPILLHAAVSAFYSR